MNTSDISATGKTKKTSSTPYKVRKCTFVDDCEFFAKTNYHMKYHLASKHNVGKRLKCHICDYTCFNNSMLNSHLKSHSQIKPYLCETCGRSYKFTTMLKKHLAKCCPNSAKSFDNLAINCSNGYLDVEIIKEKTSFADDSNIDYLDLTMKMPKNELDISSMGNNDNNDDSGDEKFIIDMTENSCYDIKDNWVESNDQFINQIIIQPGNLPPNPAVLSSIQSTNQSTNQSPNQENNQSANFSTSQLKNQSPDVMVLDLNCYTSPNKLNDQSQPPLIVDNCDYDNQPIDLSTRPANHPVVSQKIRRRKGVPLKKSSFIKHDNIEESENDDKTAE